MSIIPCTSTINRTISKWCTKHQTVNTNQNREKSELRRRSPSHFHSSVTTSHRFKPDFDLNQHPSATSTIKQVPCRHQIWPTFRPCNRHPRPVARPLRVDPSPQSQGLAGRRPSSPPSPMPQPQRLNRYHCSPSEFSLVMRKKTLTANKYCTDSWRVRRTAGKPRGPANKVGLTNFVACEHSKKITQMWWVCGQYSP